MKVTYLDRQGVLRELRRAVEDLARNRPEIQRVLLFGSLASGQAVPGSDADLLVILTHSDKRFLDRIPLYTPEGCTVGIDVFPYTQAEIDAMRTAGNRFIEGALAEGLVIW